MNMRMNRCAVITAGFAILCLFSSIPFKAAAQDNCGNIADKIGHGGILWTENAIVVQGTAAPNLSDPDKPVSAIKRETQRAATLDAYRKIAGVLAGISVTSDTLATDSPHVISRIHAYVRQPKICKTKYYADGGVDIVVKVPLTGELAKALLPSAGTNVAVSKSKYTGLIVDASDLPFAPALSPRLLAPDGSVLYSQEKVKLEIVAKRGAVKYVQNSNAAGKESVGTRPLKAKAIGLGSLSPSDLIINRKTALVLADSPAFLGYGRVVIITLPIRKIECKGLSAKVKDRLIDWERKIVLARGTGRVDFARKMDNAVRMRMMERAAEVDAQRKLLELILQLTVNGTKTLKNIPNASKHIKGVVKNAVRCDAKYFKDGTAEVVLAAPIDGMASKGADLGNPGGSKPVILEKDVTGLIIDASGLDFKPALAPKLIAPDGSELYCPDMVSKAYVQQYGVAGYRTSVEKAGYDKRTGKNPIVVHADRTSGDSSTLVLAEKDKIKISQLNNMAGLLRQGRVIIITKNIYDN